MLATLFARDPGLLDPPADHPALAGQHLSRPDDGRLLYLLQRRWRAGTALPFQPRGLLERLAALVPPPRFHLLRYHGVLAPPPSLRPRVVPRPQHDHASFKKLWADSWDPPLEHILRNALLSPLEHPGATLGDVRHLLDSPSFRRLVATQVAIARVREF